MLALLTHKHNIKILAHLGNFRKCINFRRRGFIFQTEKRWEVEIMHYRLLDMDKRNKKDVQT